MMPLFFCMAIICAMVAGAEAATRGRTGVYWIAVIFCVGSAMALAAVAR